MTTLTLVKEILRAGSWPFETAVDSLSLSYDERHRRRLRYVAAGGTTFLLDLPRATVLRDGDGMKLDDGRIVLVHAAPEPLVEITAQDTTTLVRLAWHIGNRHLAAQLEADRIVIRDDHVIVSMLRGLGARVRAFEGAFSPESGAYDDAGRHSLLLLTGRHHDGHGDHHGHADTLRLHDPPHLQDQADDPGE